MIAGKLSVKIVKIIKTIIENNHRKQSLKTIIGKQEVKNVSRKETDSQFSRQSHV